MSADKSSKLSKEARQEQAILALLQHTTLEKAAEASGVSDVTLWRWMKEPDFKRQLREARRDALSTTVGRLQTAAPAAVGSLLRVLTDQTTGAGSRIRAAQSILEFAIKALDQDELEGRVEDLERLVKGKNS